MSMTAEMTTADLAGMVAALGSLAPAVDDADRIERVRLLEELKAAAGAAQVVETAAFVVSQRAVQAVAGVPLERQGRGVAAQIGLARRMSPWQAARYVGWASILTRELPGTFAALRAGRCSEWRAMIVARETIWLSREDRAAVDVEVAPRLEQWGDRRVEAEARRAAYRLDPRGFLERSRAAERDRRVGVRPAPDTMCRLTALLPVAQGVAAYAALGRAADSTTAGGDERGRGQIMADTLVERLTGQATADAVPVEIELIMTDRTLLTDTHSDTRSANSSGNSSRNSDADADEPAVLVGYGPIPAGLARNLALADTGTQRWLRRLFLAPDTGQLAAVDSTRRRFTGNLARFIRLRDQTCRTPWCDAPIRHTDHTRPAADGGPTSIDNGQGLCETCNHARQAPGWHAHPDPTATITITTPTGRRYTSDPPDPPGSPPSFSAESRSTSGVLLAALQQHARTLALLAA